MTPYTETDRQQPDVQAAAEPATFIPTMRWIAQGLRAAVFLRPHVAGRAPAPWQLLLIALLALGAELGLSRLAIVGPAHFDVQAWVSGLWPLGLFAALGWWAFSSSYGSNSSKARGTPAASGQHSGTVAAGLALLLCASLPGTVIYQGLVAAFAHGWFSSGIFSSPWAYWGWYAVFVGWPLAITLVLIFRFAGWTWRGVAAMLALAGATGLTIWQFDARAWQQDYASAEQAAEEKPRLHLNEQTYEAQQALWPKTAAALAPERPGVVDVYGLVFAPYASEDVFLRESTLVSRVLEERFDAQGRLIHLVNHASTTATHLWATPLNMQRAIDLLAQRMNREKDVLVIYMTSHGARDFKLAAEHWPLEVDSLTPAALREALDKAGIRNRVIAVSACFSGGWVDVLAGDTTLMMTAADATHTSYGCGRRSPLTFFGRAMFDEQLRQTHSFEQAFARAVPLIRQREIDAGKEDGFSNPQIRVGAGIAPVLRELAHRLDSLPQVSAAKDLASAATLSPKTPP